MPHSFRLLSEHASQHLNAGRIGVSILVETTEIWAGSLRLSSRYFASPCSVRTETVPLVDKKGRA